MSKIVIVLLIYHRHKLIDKSKNVSFILRISNNTATIKITMSDFCRLHITTLWLESVKANKETEVIQFHK
jgi:hypothetical protein